MWERGQFPNRNGNLFREARACKFCNKVHSPRLKCTIICHYCHDIHGREDLIEGMCPKVAHHATAIQKDTSFLCKECGGEGAFEKQVETTYLETEKQFAARLMFWKES